MMRITLHALLISSTWAFLPHHNPIRHGVGPLASAGIESPGLGRPYSSQDNDNNNDKEDETSTTALPSKAGVGRRETLVAGGALAASFPYMMDMWHGGLGSLSIEELSVLQEGDAIVRHLWLGRLAYPVLIVALESGLFQALKSKPLTLEELGQRTTPPLPGHSRVMKALVATLTSLQLLEKDEHDRVRLTKAARGVLLKESPYFWGPQLLAADGTTAVLRRAVHRANSPDRVVDFASHSTAVIDSFVDSMEAHGAVTAQTTAQALQPFLSPRSHVLDMAGGSGCFARALARTTGASVTLADLPPVVARFRRLNGQAIPSVPADLFAAWPHGYNVHFLANVLHDWGEAQVGQILAHSRVSLDDTHDAQLIIVEQLLDHPPPVAASLASVSMLLGDWRTGKQYSFAELEQMALAAGFSRVERGPPCGTFYTAVIAHV